MLESQEKNLEPKVYVKFFTVDLYTLYNSVSRPLEILLFSYFLQMCCMKCVLWVNINYPKAIEYQHNKY